jgi:hypothetical protein
VQRQLQPEGGPDHAQEDPPGAARQGHGQRVVAEGTYFIFKKLVFGRKLIKFLHFFHANVNREPILQLRAATPAL